MALIRSGSSTSNLSIGSAGQARVSLYHSTGEEVFRKPVNSYQQGIDVFMESSSLTGNLNHMIVINDHPSRELEIRRLYLVVTNYRGFTAANSYVMTLSIGLINKVASADTATQSRDTTREISKSSFVYTDPVANSYSDASYFNYLDRMPAFATISGPVSGRRGQQDEFRVIDSDSWSKGIFLRYRECLCTELRAGNDLGLSGEVVIAEYDL